MATEEDKGGLLSGIKAVSTEEDPEEEGEAPTEAPFTKSPSAKGGKEQAMEVDDVAAETGDANTEKEKPDEEVDEVATLDEPKVVGGGGDKDTESGDSKEADQSKREVGDVDMSKDGGDQSKSDIDQEGAASEAGSATGQEEGSAQASSRPTTPDSRSISPAPSSDVSSASGVTPSTEKKKRKRRSTGDHASLHSVEEAADELRLLQDPVDREVDAGDDYEMVEAISERHNYATRKKSPKWKYKQPGGAAGGSIRDEWLLPFGEGWMREIVIRNSAAEDHTGRKPADVYYYAPNKKKLRSAPEISKYLDSVAVKGKSRLDLSCFTFSKTQIYKEPSEFVRHAGAGKGRGGGKIISVSDKPMKFRSPRTESPVGRGKAAKGSGVKVEPLKVEPLSPDSLAGIKPVSTSTPAAGTPDGVRRSVAKKHTGKRSITQVSRSSPVAEITAKKFKANTPNNTTAKAVVGDSRLCGLDCPGRTGIPPSLHCDVCMCLFHPECVGVLGSMHVKAFTCIGCRKVSNNSQSSAPIVVYPGRDTESPAGRSVIKLVPQPMKQSVPRATLPTLIRAPGGATMSVLPPAAPPNLVTAIGFRQPAVSVQSAHHHIISVSSAAAAVATGPQQPTPVSLVQNNTPMTGITVPAQPSLAGLQSMIPQMQQSLLPQPVRLTFPATDPKSVTGQLLTLPSSLTRKVNLTKSLHIKVGEQRLAVPSTCFITTAEGVKVLLPPGALPPQLVQPGSSKPLSLTFQGDKESQTLSVSALDSAQPSQCSTNGTSSSSVTHTAAVSTAVATSISTSSSGKGKRQAKNLCYFNKLHAGFDCMLLIFRYLDVTDLLRAGRVCRTWKNVSSHPTLWRTVRLEWSCVADWEGAAKHFCRFGTHTLDMRGLVHYEDKNRTWHQFAGVLDNLCCLRQLMFGQCPGSILHLVSEKLINLELLYAEFVADTMQEPGMWSNNTKLDLGKFHKLEQLRELKVRAVCGLVMPAFSFSGGLSGLGQLTRLKTLSLTTLRDIPGLEFTFLGSLENLEVLEIGDCNCWTAESFESLGKLAKLTSLRIESGGDLPDLGMGAALAKLTKLTHLELIKYVVSEGLSESLRELTHIQTFSIWPETEKQAPLMNRNTLSAVKHMTFLKHLEWGILTDKPVVENGSPDDEASAARAEIERQRLQSIPLLVENAAAEAEGEGTVEYLDINKLMEQLCASLPDTKIRAFRVPAVHAQVHQE